MWLVVRVLLVRLFSLPRFVISVEVCFRVNIDRAVFYCKNYSKFLVPVINWTPECVSLWNILQNIKQRILAFALENTPETFIHDVIRTVSIKFAETVIILFNSKDTAVVGIVI